MLMHVRIFNNKANCSAKRWKLNFFSLSVSFLLAHKHNSGIFTISLNKHLLLLNFVIIIKCSEIIVHEFSRFCVFAYGSTDSFPLPASFDCNYLCHIFTQLISSSSRSRNASKNLLLECFVNFHFCQNKHSYKCLKFSRRFSSSANSPEDKNAWTIYIKNYYCGETFPN